MGLLQHGSYGISVTDVKPATRITQSTGYGASRGMVHNRAQLVGETEAIQTV